MVWKFLSRLSSLRFSIALLLLLASVSIIGTVIEQDQSLSYYKLNYPESKPAFWLITWRQIIGLGLNHVYSNYCFLALLLLFFLSLLLCTFSTQLPILKHARQWSFFYTQPSLESVVHYTQPSFGSLSNFVYVLNLNNYYVFHKGVAVYSYKGLLGRIAPIFVHLSIILTLIGSLLGFMGGFVVQEMVPSGEVFHVQNTVKSGYYSVMPYGFLAKVNDFFATFNNDQSVQQFFSNISILNNQGRTVLNSPIAVNSPLRFRGVTFYQTDWRINAVRVRVGSTSLLTKVLQKSSIDSSGSHVWVSGLAVDNKHRIFIVISGLGDHVLLYDDTGKLIIQANYGSSNVIYGVPVVFKDLISSTGLQIKADPGLYVTYAGFLILIVNIAASYMSYSQIWASQSKQGISFSGTTNRAFLSFENEIAQVYLKYRILSSFFD